jgi:hypothetical protein
MKHHDRGNDAVHTAVTRAFQAKRPDFGVRGMVNIHKYDTRTQVLNSALHRHEYTREALTVLNKRVLDHFNLKVKSTLWSHLAGMRDQGSVILVDGAVFTGSGQDFKLVSFQSVITLRTDKDKWVSREI